MADQEDDGAAQLLVAFSAAPPPAGGSGGGPVGGAGAWRLRCLDPSHEATCGRCAAAPLLGEEQQYELVGDPGRKNGEKLLKSLLSRTPEWRSPDERAAAARACDATGHTGLARVMRGLDTSAALRKRDMLYLARIWHYRSYLWRPRVSRRRGEGRAEAAAAPHAAAVAPRAPPAPRGAPVPPPPQLPPPLAALNLAELPPLVKLLLPMLAQQHAASQQQAAAAQAAYIQLLLSNAAAAPALPPPAAEAEAGAVAAHQAAVAAAAAQLAAAPPHVAALLAALHAPQPPQPVQPDFAAAMAALGHAAPAV